MKSRNSLHKTGSSSTDKDFKSLGELILFRYLYFDRTNNSFINDKSYDLYCCYDLIKKQDEDFKNLLSDLYALSTETNFNNISIDVLNALTNDDVYGQPFTNILYKEVNSTGEYKNLEDIDWDLKDQLESLYNYFIDNAEANKNITPSIEQSNPVKLVADSQRTIIDGDNYIVGPYKIEELINIEVELWLTLLYPNRKKLPVRMNAHRQNRSIFRG